MRKVAFISLVVFFMLCGTAFASDFQTKGCAVVTGIRSNYISATEYRNTDLFVTNVSGCDVTCRVTLYDHAGIDVTKYVYIYSGSDAHHGSAIISKGEGEFSLPAGATRTVHVQVMSTDRELVGSAVLEWSSKDVSVQKALIASGDRSIFKGNRMCSGSFVINGDRPF